MAFAVDFDMKKFSNLYTFWKWQGDIIIVNFNNKVSCHLINQPLLGTRD